jgi:uncharacterized membrane protein YoaK (UPF0700 family)
VIELPSLPILCGAGILHFTIGAMAATIAHRKGRKLSLWLPIGLIVGTPALVAAVLLDKGKNPAR